MMRLPSKLKKPDAFFGIFVTVLASMMTLKSRDDSKKADIQESASLQKTHSTSEQSAPSSPAPAFIQNPDPVGEEPVDPGQTTEEALDNLGNKIEASLNSDDISEAVKLIAQRSLIHVMSTLRMQGSNRAGDLHRLHLKDMERYAEMHPQLRGSYDYQMTLLTVALSSEDLPMLEKRVRSINAQFPELVEKDNNCINFFLAVRKKDSHASEWQSSCESGQSEYSTSAKGISETIKKNSPFLDKS